MRLWFALGICLPIGGCFGVGSDAHIYPSPFGQRVAGNEAYVSVSNVWNEIDALQLAEPHCGKYGKVARFNHMEGTRAIFDCVSRR